MSPAKHLGTMAMTFHTGDNDYAVSGNILHYYIPLIIAHLMFQMSDLKSLVVTAAKAKACCVRTMLKRYE